MKETLCLLHVSNCSGTSSQGKQSMGQPCLALTQTKQEMRSASCLSNMAVWQAQWHLNNRHPKHMLCAESLAKDWLPRGVLSVRESEDRGFSSQFIADDTL